MLAVIRSTARFMSSGPNGQSGALYAYDRQALTRFLQINAHAVHAAGLPLDPDEFVLHVASIWFEEQHPAYRVITAAFGDKA